MIAVPLQTKSHVCTALSTICSRTKSIYGNATLLQNFAIATFRGRARRSATEAGRTQPAKGQRGMSYKLIVYINLGVGIKIPRIEIGIRGDESQEELEEFAREAFFKQCSYRHEVVCD
jgi:hypothetical protein